MTERVSWSAIEDNFLAQNVQPSNFDMNHKIKWLQISQKLNRVLNVDKSSKQCRQRWFNQLQPGLSRETEWSSIEQEKVCLLQQKYGNKWALIAKQLPGRTDNAIKNYFYSHLRKSLRKINQYLIQHRNIKNYKATKLISQSIIGKIIALTVGKTVRLKVKNEDTMQRARYIKDALIKLWFDHFSQQEMQQTISNIIYFNKGCRKVRGKSKKTNKQFQDYFESDVDHSEIQQCESKMYFNSSISPPSIQNEIQSINWKRNIQFNQNSFGEPCESKREEIFDQNSQIYQQIQEDFSIKQMQIQNNCQESKQKQLTDTSSNILVEYFDENRKNQVYLPFFQTQDHEVIPIYLEEYRVNNSFLNDSLIKDISQPICNWIKISNYPTFSSNLYEYDINSSQYEILNTIKESNSSLFRHFSFQ